MHRKTWLRFAVMAAAITQTFAPALASEGEFPPCGTFSVSGGDFSVTLVDRDAAGDSIGDQRIGERVLLNAAGDAVGMLRWVEHVVDTDENGGSVTITQSKIVFSLPEGTLHASGELKTQNAMDSENQPWKENAFAMLGGTGAFAQSRGEILATFMPGKPSTYDIRLHCN